MYLVITGLEDLEDQQGTRFESANDYFMGSEYFGPHLRQIEQFGVMLEVTRIREPSNSKIPYHAGTPSAQDARDILQKIVRTSVLMPFPGL